MMDDMSAFGSKADVCVAKPHVRFTPNSDRKSGHPQTAMSALPLKAADVCDALAHVSFGPEADIATAQTERPPRGGLSEVQFVLLTLRVQLFASGDARVVRLDQCRPQRAEARRGAEWRPPARHCRCRR
jgi:hypothetical protein